MSFTRKRIDVTLSLGTGTFGEGDANTVTLTGLRVHAIIQATYGDAMPAAHVRIFGLTLQMLNELTSVGLINSGVRFKNTMLLAAGDDETGLSSIYNGTINESWANLDGMPESCLEIIGVAGLAASLKPVGALSVQGQADVATIMQSLATQMGFAFENNGVQVQLSNPYFPGTALAQAKACARAADISMTIDRGTLAIWPKFGFRADPEGPPLISPATGMRGYPRYSSNGVEVSTLFNPQIKPGGQIEIQSQLQMACGKWLVSNATHILESETPNGQWFTGILARPQSV
ncbi:baseplate hub protein [Ralstonia pickettii]|uniref:baseplate hub protein n=1 Tax=Ralstonia pickettii TaxID=329 RepID=UPI0015FA0ECC|nr:hypothetical protein [Ralstonia pickettii]MBB0026832.1 hypothetical protein [Ralstonia pickettii]MBB0034670.1 hypothetical protein [Ralstonia pickettii]MBB0099995.1 hypothetical protein [Ralstonia pickettii]MBB0109954.1 hypothetical protein [Ralstonia pickettii]MBB0130934.1 hypothetical protein [Ralstonia pickettii]